MIHLAQKAQITLLVTKKVSILVKYLDFVNLFLKKLVAKLFKYSEINKYSINLELDQQILDELIYSLEPIELEILKIYIKTNLANDLIYPSNSPTKAAILFV